MSKKYANLGFFFQRGYYNDLKSTILSDKSEQKTYFEKRNNDLIDSSKLKCKPDFQIKESVPLSLQTIYPGLITGIGMAHATGMEGEGKLGMAFDYTSGLPYIPGSSVKGLLRSIFPFVQKNKDEYAEKQLAEKHQYMKSVWDDLRSKWEDNSNPLPDLEDKDFDMLAEWIFEGKSNKVNLSIYERDIFFDAQIEGDYLQKGFLGFDYITPHKEALKDPTPIKFLKILPNVSFVFYFKLSDSKLSSGKIIPAKAKRMLFKEILTTVGIGAKTNVGYGQLKSEE